MRRRETWEFPVAEVAAALRALSSTLRLYVRCHDYHWIARPAELAQIRDYLAAWRRG
jgi:hypothetical protein